MSPSRPLCPALPVVDKKARDVPAAGPSLVSLTLLLLAGMPQLSSWGGATPVSYFVSTAALLMTARPSCVFACTMTLPFPASHMSVVIVSPG